MHGNQGGTVFLLRSFHGAQQLLAGARSLTLRGLYAEAKEGAYRAEKAAQRNAEVATPSSHACVHRPDVDSYTLMS